jgi:SAM-dependent methyltransferase
LSGNAAAFSYAGQELELFQEAHRWKSYWSGSIGPYIHGDVLEVGAGIGANTSLLAGLSYREWVCLEPDASLATRVALPTARHRMIVGTAGTFSPAPQFDTILYLDVLEHIEDDRAELRTAGKLLRTGGSLIVLAPAHMSLYSPFDRAIGHFRRYSAAMLRAITPPGFRMERLCYLDSCGALASVCNRFLLRSPIPTRRQLLTWDRVLVPCSRWLDPLLLHRAGKSVLAIWSRDGGEDLRSGAGE